MIIRGVYVHNFLSFRELQWRGLDDGLNVIVGPNGSGKTNLFRALRAAVDALDIQEHRVWSHSAHLGSGEEKFAISLDLEFNGEWEKRTLLAFFAAALSDQQEILGKVGSGRVTDQGVEQFSTALLEQLSYKDINWLVQGRLVVEWGGDRWRYHYESMNGDPYFRLDLEYSQFSTRGHGNGPTTHYSLFSAWHQVLSESSRVMLEKHLGGESRELPPPALRQLLSREKGQEYRSTVSAKVRIPSGVYLPTHRELSRLIGKRLEFSRDYDLRFLFHTILKRSIVFTDNVRREPQSDFKVGRVTREVDDMSNGDQLALFLFRRKNGTAKERRLYESIQRTFKNLTERTFDAALAPEKETPLGFTTNDDELTTLSLLLTTGTQNGDVPLEFSGAGISEALFLSAILSGTDDKVILLDEPAQNLHPIVQTALLKEIEISRNNQYFIVTHSPALVPADALNSISRFTSTKDQTARSSLDAGSIKPIDLSKIKMELRRSADVRGLLFSRGVILCEGETELGSLPLWFRKDSHRPLESLDIAMYWVGGAQRFETYVRLLQAFSIPWAIICDGDAIGDSPCGKTLAAQLKRAEVTGVAKDTKNGFDERKAYLEGFGVFTTAGTASEAFEHVPEIVEHLPEAVKSEPHSKVRQARFIAENYPCPRPVLEMMDKAVNHLESLIAAEQGSR